MKSNFSILLAFVCATACGSAVEAPDIDLNLHTPTTSDELVVSVSQIYDEPIRYRWTRDGEATGFEGPVLPSTATRKGEYWEVAAALEARDGRLGPETVEPAWVVNSLPITSAWVEPSAPMPGDDLACRYSVYDPDTWDEHTTETVWYLNGTAVSTGEVLPAASLTAEDVAYCTAHSADDEAQGPSTTSEAVRYGNSPPSVEWLVLEPAAPVSGVDVFARAEGSDPEGDEVTFRYRWFHNGIEATTSERISGELLTAGDRIQVEVTPWDGYTEGAPRLSARVEVQNGAPVLASVTLTPKEATASDILRAIPGPTTDPEDDAIVVSYRWWVQGVMVQEGLEDTLAAGLASKHEEVDVEATPSDGVNTGESVRSGAVTLRNSPPAIASASLSTLEVYEGTTVRCLGSGWSDADADPEDYRAIWTVNGSAGSPTVVTLSGSSFDRGDTISCELFPWDGEESGAGVESETITVLNTPPSVAVPSMEARTLIEDGLTCTILVEATDADGDDIELTYRWLHDGDLTAHSDETVEADDLAAGRWTCGVTASDGEDDAAEVSVTSRVVGVLGSQTAASSDVTIDGSSGALGSGLVVGDATGDGIADTLVAAPGEGAVHLFAGPISAAALETSDADVSLTGAGAATLLAGQDLDADGSADLLIGSEEGAGTVWLIRSSPTSGTLDSVADAVVTGDAEGDALGAALGAGTLGASTVWLAGAPAADDPGDGAGLVLGFEDVSGTLTPSDAVFGITGDTDGDAAGTALLVADLDGDGVDDLAVAAPGSDTGAVDAGAVAIFSGGPSGSGALSDAATHITGGASGDELGAFVHAEDVDGDGYADLLVSALGAGGGSGEVVVLSGPVSSGTTLSAVVTITGDADALLGSSLDTGDVDGDGAFDLVIGAAGDDAVATDAGVALVFFGDLSGSYAQSDAEIDVSGATSSDRVGASVRLGDTDGDGLDDLLVGAPGVDDGGVGAGALWIWFSGS